MQQHSRIIPIAQQVQYAGTRRASLRSTALAYARNGWRIFPIYASDANGYCSCGHTDCPGPGKHPRTLNGAGDATTSEHIVARWWDQDDTACIGIATGNGLLVIEVDPQRGGSLEQLQELYALPETALVRTGGGQWHLYYTYTPTLTLRNTVERLGDGIDVYADGGYVIAPPSRHPSGKRSAWLNSLAPTPLPAVLLPTLLNSRPSNMGRALQMPIDEPAELLQAMQEMADKPPSLLERATLRTPAELLVTGERRIAALTHLAAALHEQGASDDVLKITLTAFNRIQCCPPLPKEEVRQVMVLYATGRNW